MRFLFRHARLDFDGPRVETWPKELIVIPPGVRRPLLLGRCFQDRMSECGSKIAVRLKNQMRKAKVESDERIIKKWDEK